MSHHALMRHLQIGMVRWGLASLLAVASPSCGNGESQQELERQDTRGDQVASDLIPRDWKEDLTRDLTDAGEDLPHDSFTGDHGRDLDTVAGDQGQVLDSLTDLGSVEVVDGGLDGSPDATGGTDLWSKCDPNDPPICSPAGDVVRCNLEGTGYDLQTDCAHGSQICADGQCLEVLCIPATTRCDGNTLLTCAEDGQTEAPTACAEVGKFCDPETALCKDRICNPGVSSCSQAGDAVKCNAVGGGFDLVDDCGSLGCLGGSCIKGCGDNSCDAPEDCNTCVEDCGCGQGVCQPSGSCCTLSCGAGDDCPSLCQELRVAPGSTQPFEPGPENSLGVGLDADGYLVMDSTKLDLHALWVANSADDTVTRLDTRTGRQTGRFMVCDNPAKVAVDLLGDLWVGCLGDTKVVKVSGAEARCVDRNNSGTIETSRDLNGDGVFQLEEVLDGAQDECVLFATSPGGKIIRALGVDRQNHCWAASWSSAELYRLHPDDGHLVQFIKLPTSPFGLVIDGKGIVWCSTLGSTLLRVDPTTGQVQSISSPSNYSVNLDQKGRPWVGGSFSRYDPATGQWTDTGIYARGVAGSTDGFVYGVTAGTLHRINMDTMAAESIDTTGLGAVGVALDSDGYVWTINTGSSDASKVDPKTKTVLGRYPVGSGGETFSDLTGYTLNNFTAPTGFLEVTLGGATETPIQWKDLRFGAAFPEGTWVEVLVRAADTIQALPEAKWQGPLGPYSDVVWPLSLTGIPNLEGRYLQVRLGLHSQYRSATPTVWSVAANGERP